MHDVRAGGDGGSSSAKLHIRSLLDFGSWLGNTITADADGGLNFQSHRTTEPQPPAHRVYGPERATEVRDQKRHVSYDFYDFYIFYELLRAVSCGPVALLAQLHFGSDALCLEAPPVTR
jgi:hypothetical protein